MAGRAATSDVRDLWPRILLCRREGDMEDSSFASLRLDKELCWGPFQQGFRQEAWGTLFGVTSRSVPPDNISLGCLRRRHRYSDTVLNWRHDRIGTTVHNHSFIPSSSLILGFVQFNM
jgi:hypothetical protein